MRRAGRQPDRLENSSRLKAFPSLPPPSFGPPSRQRSMPIATSYYWVIRSSGTRRSVLFKCRPCYPSHPALRPARLINGDHDRCLPEMLVCQLSCSTSWGELSHPLCGCFRTSCGSLFAKTSVTKLIDQGVIHRVDRDNKYYLSPTPKGQN
jgi:hypothetical protein